MGEYTVARGTRDLLFIDKKKERLVCEIIEAVASTYGFNMIETPMFESTSLFNRSVGESSDIVNKEMYTFMDKGDRSITLRPEGTAGAIRLYVNNKLYANPDNPTKLMYLGPVFRYERPQAGRYRQFKQFGFEVIGLKNPYVDVELILMCTNILETLGFENLKIKINSLGDEASRKAYGEALKEYFKPYLQGENALCEDCVRRWGQNPLRILDCKVDVDHPAFASAPKIKDYLNDESKEYFAKVLDLLKTMNVSYEVDENLVRGLDYYSDVVFEIYQEGKNFGALGAGGRYDKLVHEVGGPDSPATGMAFGVDRLVLAMEQDNLFDNIENYDTDVVVIPLGKETKDYAFKTAEFLRKNGLITEIDFQDKSINAQLKMAVRKFAKAAVIIGEDELKAGTFIVKDLEHVEQYEVEEKDLLEAIDHILEKECDHDHE